MTKEEMDFLGSMNMCDEISNEAYQKIMTHCEEQEPCEDCISRQVVLDCFKKWQPYMATRLLDFEKELSELPPVTPQPKIGYWIEDAKTYYEELNKRGLGVDEYTPYFVDDIACSECLAKYSVIDNETQFFKFCPNCGARMEVEYKWR